MGSFIEAGKTADFKDGTTVKIQVEGQDIMVVRAGDDFYAVGNKCPHLGGDLSKGALDGTVVTCPRHGSQFDVRDGSVVRWLKGSGIISSLGKALKSPHTLQTYDVKTEGDKLLVEV